MSSGTSRSHHRAAGKRRVRRRKQSHSNSSPQPTSPVAMSTSRSQTPSVPAHNPATLSPPPNLTPLQMAQYMAERVAHSTGMAVQKLGLQKHKPETPERTPSEPNLHHMSPQDHVNLPSTQHAASHHTDSKYLDSQGYSSGDEASNAETHLPHPPSRPVQPNITNRRSTSPLDVEHSPHLATTDTPQQYYSTPLTTSELASQTTPPPLHTPLIHTPADINYPNGYSSAEKAAYVARLVADSTGIAVQKLSESMSERKQLSLSSGEQPSLDVPSPFSPLAGTT